MNLHCLDPNPVSDLPILLLHGLGADGSSWILQFDPLISAGFRPIAPDAPGFGESPYDGRGWSIRRAARDTADLLMNLGAGPADVVGISMGGVIAQQLSLDYPQLVRRLVLVSTFSYLRPVTLRGWFYLIRRGVLVHILGLRTQAGIVARHLFPEPGQEPIREELIRQITRADPGAYRAAMRALGMYNSSARLHELNIPTLVITGDHDRTVPPRNQRRLADLIPGAEQLIIPGAGHAVSIDRPEAFNSALLDFLRR